MSVHRRWHVSQRTLPSTAPCNSALRTKMLSTSPDQSRAVRGFGMVPTSSVVPRKQMAVADADVGKTRRASCFFCGFCVAMLRVQGSSSSSHFFNATFFRELLGDQIFFPLLRMGRDSALQECGEGNQHLSSISQGIIECLPVVAVFPVMVRNHIFEMPGFLKFTICAASARLNILEAFAESSSFWRRVRRSNLRLMRSVTRSESETLRSGA